MKYQASMIASSFARPRGVGGTGSGRWFTTLLLAIGLGLPGVAQAQSIYSVSVRSEPYRALPIDGGTVDTHAFSAVDDGYLTLSLPFTVRFFGEEKQHLLFNANGWAAWDITSNPSSGWVNKNFPDSTAPNDLMAVWWDDNYCDNGLKTQVLGNAPARIFVAEWDCTRRSTDLPGRFQAQIWFYEGSSTLEFRYGDSTVNSTATTASMGIENKTGTIGYEVPSRNGTICNPNCTFADWLTHSVVTFSQGPELRVSEVTGSEEGFAGIPMPLTATITNVGGKTAENFTVRFYVSDRDVLDEGAIELATLDSDLRSLVPQESTTYEVAPRLPIVLDEGEYYILAEADPHRNVPETSRADNVGVFGPFRIGIRAPNLHVPWVQAPDLAAPGEEITLRWLVGNSGNLVANVIPYRVVIDRNRHVAPTSRTIAVGTIGSLEMGQESILEAVVEIPADLEPGLHYLGVEIDPNRIVFEHDRSDNAGVSLPVMVTTEELVVLTEALPIANLHGSYEIRLMAAGGDGLHVWTLKEGSSFPPGMRLEVRESQQGERATFLTGKPGAVGIFPFTLVVQSAGLRVEKDFELEISNAQSALAIVTEHLADASFGFDYRDELVAIGGLPPYNWEVVRNELPLGLFLRSDGVISGRPQKDGVFPVTFRVTDSEGRRASKELRIEVAPPASLTCVTRELPTLQPGEFVELPLVAAGGRKRSDGTYLWTSAGVLRLAQELGEESGPLQQDFGLNVASNGVVTGSPKLFGTFIWNLELRDDTPGTVVRCPVIVRVPRDRGLTVVTGQLPTAIAGRSYRAPLEAFGGDGTYTWSEYGSGRVLERLGLEFDAVGNLVGIPRLDALEGEPEREFTLTLRVKDELNRIGIGVVSLRLQAAATKGAEPKGSDEGGGCQTGEGAPAPWLLALSVLALRRRRR